MGSCAANPDRHARSNDNRLAATDSLDRIDAGKRVPHILDNLLKQLCLLAASQPRRQGFDFVIGLTCQTSQSSLSL